MSQTESAHGRQRAMARTLMAMAILAVALPVVFIVSFAWLTYDSYFSSARQQLVRTVDVVREHAIKVFETHRLVAGQVEEILAGRSDAEVRADEAGISRRLKTLADSLPQVQDLWVLDGEGRPLVSANVFPIPAALDLADRGYFRVFKDGLMSPGALYVSEVLRGRVQGIPFFQVSKERRTAASAAFAGVIAVSVQPLYFQAFYGGVAAGGLDTMTLIRADGAVLARYPESADPLPKLPPESAFIRSIRASPESGLYETISAFDGAPRLIAYQRLPDYPLYVTAGINRSAIVAKWRATMARQLIFIIPAAAGLLTLAMLALRFTRREHIALDRARDEAARREAVEAQLRQAQKMEAIGRLTGGVAHDFNNLLTIVIGNLDLLKDRLPDPDPMVRRLVDHAREGARRAAELTQRLLAFSRQQPLLPVPIDANRLIADMSDLLRRTLGETVEVETVLAGGLWRFSADLNQLENVILNLAVNARDAMADGGKLTIETANAHLDEAYAANHDDVVPGQYVLIAVSDSGAGMTRDVLDRAFEPFFTTKPSGCGTGLGLSQTYGFVKQSGGHVAIYSEPGEGSIIRLYLPRLTVDAGEAPAVREQPASSHCRSTGGGETVLVVEDDAMVRRFAVEVLQTTGYRVLAAEDGPQALDLVKVNPDIRLLFTDVVLSGPLNGRALADEVIRQDPRIKVLFTTGYTRNAIIHHGRLDDDVNFIGKPYSASALADKLRAVLDGLAVPSKAGSGDESAASPSNPAA